jgi:protein TonB
LVTARVRWVLPEDAPAGPTFLELSNLITPADYPPEARALHQQGRVGVVLEVGRDGAVTACHVYMSSGSTALDERTCTILQARAHLPVTLNVEGQPVTSVTGAMVTWTLPTP